MSKDNVDQSRRDVLKRFMAGFGAVALLAVPSAAAWAQAPSGQQEGAGRRRRGEPPSGTRPEGETRPEGAGPRQRPEGGTRPEGSRPEGSGGSGQRRGRPKRPSTNG